MNLRWSFIVFAFLVQPRLAAAEEPAVVAEGTPTVPPTVAPTVTPTVDEKVEGDEAHAGAVEEKTVPPVPAADPMDALLRDQLADKLESVVSYAMRCPSKADFVRNATAMLASTPKGKPETCDQIAVSQFRSLTTARYLKPGANAEPVPVDNIKASVRNLCAQILSGQSPNALGLLHEFSCQPKDEERFSETDYEEALYGDHSKLDAAEKARRGRQRALAEQEVANYTDHYKAIGSKGWKAEYELALAEALKSSPLINDPSPQMQRDLVRMCPGFMALTPADRTRVWSAVFDAMSMAESAHNPSTTYRESFGPLSTGMLQISEASARGHGGNCQGATTQRLMDPIFNLKCGVSIMESQRRTGRSIFGNTSYYWSVLNTRQNGFPKVMGRLNAVKADPVRWPAACGG
jgi:hypothetical protein